MKREYKTQNEIFSLNSTIESTKIHIPFAIVSISICKIKIKCYDGNFGSRDIYGDKKIGTGTGFFIKFKDPNSDNRFKYFLMTCEHVIQKEIIEEEPIEFDIVYFYEKYSKKFKFKKSERFIKEYRSDYNIDITIVEIKPNEIPVILFLEPDYNINNYQKYLNNEIIVHQYPKGLEQCVSQGKIIKINNKEITHESSTEPGSSGSPIVIKNQIEVIGVHKSGNEEDKMNFGNLIIDVIKDVEKIRDVDYILEEGINKNNYTAQKVTIIKTGDSRKYTNYPYEILLKKLNEKMIDFSVTNTENNIKYSKRINYNNLGKKFEQFDYEIYYFNINENNNFLIITLNNKQIYQLDKANESKENYIIAKVSVEVPRNKNKLVQIINSFENSIRENQYEQTNRKINPNKPYSEIMDFAKNYENENEIKDNCQILINSKKIPFTYKYEFQYSGTYTIKYIFPKKLTKADYLFYNCNLLNSIDLSHFKTDKITNMESMFEGCTFLSEVNLTNINTINVNNMFSMFKKCGSLNFLDFSSFNTQNVTNMRMMFEECKSLSTLDLSYFDTKNVTAMRSMFDMCSSLKDLDLSSFKTPKLIDISFMFYCCYSLNSIDLYNFNTENVVDQDKVFYNCNKIDKDKVRTKDDNILYALSKCQIF